MPGKYGFIIISPVAPSRSMTPSHPASLLSSVGSGCTSFRRAKSSGGKSVCRSGWDQDIVTPHARSRGLGSLSTTVYDIPFYIHKHTDQSLEKGTCCLPSSSRGQWQGPQDLRQSQHPRHTAYTLSFVREVDLPAPIMITLKSLSMAKMLDFRRYCFEEDNTADTDNHLVEDPSSFFFVVAFFLESGELQQQPLNCSHS